jgi:hypothetical protein
MWINSGDHDHTFAMGNGAGDRRGASGVRAVMLDYMFFPACGVLY